MSENQATTPDRPEDLDRAGKPDHAGEADWDAIVVGAGFSGVGAFRAICQEVADQGYQGLVLSRHEAPPR